MFPKEEIGKEMMEIKDEIYKVVMKHARSRKGDIIIEPIIAIYTFLFYYSRMVTNPANEYFMSSQNMVDLYTAYHEKLIEKVKKYDFKSTAESMYDFSPPPAAG